ncbi:hypothetical protein KFK09_024188 [Dendrobium nobile]|uniref:CBS domain-containing protein n=1 Tax=Dendrobium nobile TaxID=94219 RepID=A0A8T3ACB0_DENNO|nr:hypothetical protein KFK09_024188 [Dendrobium nobile]
MATTTGILLCNSVLLPPKTLNSFPLLTTVRANLSWIDVTNENLRSMLFSGVRYERAKQFRAPVFSSSPAGDLRPEIDENPEGILSGEWPENFSLLSYDDLKAYLETQIASEKMKPSALLGEVMSTSIRTATADQTLEEIDHHFEIVSGLPVINENLKCIGVISKKDKAKASNGLKSKVGEVMSSPAVTLSPEKTVLDAATLMLKKKVHRIPILNEKQQVVGIVTRTDVFQALEATEA